MLNLNEKPEGNTFDQVTVSNILDPSRINLSLMNKVGLDENKDQKLNLTIEPLYLRIGFRHVDFANVVMSQVNQTLDYVKSL